MDRGAWQATVHGVAKSQKQLSDFHTTKTSWRPSSMRLLHTFYSRNFKSSAYTFKSFNLFWVCVCVCVCTLCKLVVYFHSLYVSVQISQHYLLKGLPFILWSFVLDWVSEWSHSVVFDSVTPWTVATRLLHPWNFPGKNTEVGCHFLLQGIFPTQGSNPILPHYCLSHQGSPALHCRSIKMKRFTVLPINICF